MIICQALEAHLLGRNRDFSDQLAALQEQRQLGGRELDLGGAFSGPQLSESSLLEPLGVQAQAGAVPHQDLRPLAIAGDEEEQVAGQWVATEVGPDQAVQAVEALPHVDRQSVGEDPDGAGRADHCSTCSR